MSEKVHYFVLLYQKKVAEIEERIKSEKNTKAITGLRQELKVMKETLADLKSDEYIEM